MVDVREDVLERSLDVRRLQRGRFDEGQTLVTRETLRVLSLHAAQVFQVALVADQHDDDVGVSVIPQLFQPFLHVVVRLCVSEKVGYGAYFTVGVKS